MTVQGMTEAEVLAAIDELDTAKPQSDAAAEEAALLDQSVDPNIKPDSVVPAGEYLVKFVEVTVKKSAVRDERDPVTHVVTRKGGNLYLNVKLQVLTGEYAGWSIYEMVMLEGKGAARLALLASRLGFYDHQNKCLAGFPTPTPTAGMLKERLLGQVVFVETEVEAGRVWNGKKQPDRAKVTFNGYLEMPPEFAAPAEPGPPLTSSTATGLVVPAPPQPPEPPQTVAEPGPPAPPAWG
jgi:hypothetical protein